MTYSNGSTYEGDWKDDEIKGKGICKHSNGTVYERDDWAPPYGTGNGMYIYCNGTIYEGDLKYGQRNGKGKYIYSNGKILEGNWENNQFVK
jgi:hypothetical protein